MAVERAPIPGSTAPAVFVAGPLGEVERTVRRGGLRQAGQKGRPVFAGLPFCLAVRGSELGTLRSSVTRYGQVTGAVGTVNGSPWPTMNVPVNLA